jgi:hypothetical protein
MKPWIVLTVDLTDEDTTLLSHEDFNTQSEAEARYQKLVPILSNVYLVNVIKQSEHI